MHISQYLNPEFLLQTFGIIGLLIIVFAESGLFFGFFFPGDSLLFTAGFLAPMLGIPFWFLIIGVSVAAILGDSVGYWFGKEIGPALFTKEDSFFFKKEYVARAQHFFETHGPKAIILARFIPVVRTFVPIIAGVGSMKYSKFITFNIIGGVAWGAGFTSLGYFLGSAIPGIEKYLSYIILAIIVISFIPVITEIRSGMKQNKK